MKYISTLIALILFSFISTAQNSKNIPKLYHKKLFNSIAGRYANVDVTMGYAKGTGSIIIGSIEIGDNVIIAPNLVITKTIESNNKILTNT